MLWEDLVTSDTIWEPIYRNLLGEDDPATDQVVQDLPWEWYSLADSSEDLQQEREARYGPLISRWFHEIKFETTMDNRYCPHTPYHPLYTFRKDDPRPYYYRLCE